MAAAVNNFGSRADRVEMGPRITIRMKAKRRLLPVNVLIRLLAGSARFQSLTPFLVKLIPTCTVLHFRVKTGQLHFPSSSLGGEKQGAAVCPPPWALKAPLDA